MMAYYDVVVYTTSFHAYAGRYKILIGQRKVCRDYEFVIYIRFISDVLLTNSRFVKCVWGSACGLPNFTNLLWVRSTSEANINLITNTIMFVFLKLISEGFIEGQGLTSSHVACTLKYDVINLRHQRIFRTGKCYII